MTSSGDPGVASAAPEPAPEGEQWHDNGSQSRRSLTAAIVLAIAIALLAAAVWGVLRAVLDLGVGLLAVAAVGGWAIGLVIRQAAASPFVAIGIAALAWLLGLVASWVISMAILQGSSRTFFERLQATPFTDWMSPQFGVLEVAGLLAYAAAAAYGARRPSG